MMEVNCDFLLLKGVSQDVLDNFNQHGINGSTFLEMNEEYLKEVAPRIADRINLNENSGILPILQSPEMKASSALPDRSLFCYMH